MDDYEKLRADYERMKNNEETKIRAKERAAIVAWLRDGPARMEKQRAVGAISLHHMFDAGSLTTCMEAANAIERGEHLEPSGDIDRTEK